MGSFGFGCATRRSSASAWSIRSGIPAPPPWKRATPPSPIRSGRITGTPRTIACRCGAIACWPALSRSRAVQMRSVSTSARSSGARDGVPPSASTSPSASAAISASAAAWPVCGSTTPLQTSPATARSRGSPSAARGQASAR